MIKKIMTNENRTLTRHDAGKKTRTLNAIQKVLVYLFVSHNLPTCKVIFKTGYLFPLLPMLVQAKKDANPGLECEFGQLFNIN